MMGSGNIYFLSYMGAPAGISISSGKLCTRGGLVCSVRSTVELLASLTRLCGFYRFCYGALLLLVFTTHMPIVDEPYTLDRLRGSIRSVACEQQIVAWLHAPCYERDQIVSDELRRAQIPLYV